MSGSKTRWGCTPQPATVALKHARVARQRERLLHSGAEQTGPDNHRNATEDLERMTMARIGMTAFDFSFRNPLRRAWLWPLALLLPACSSPDGSERTSSGNLVVAKKPGGPRGMRVRLSQLSRLRPSVIAIAGLSPGGVQVISTNQRSAAGSLSPTVQARVLPGETAWSLVTSDGSPLTLDSTVSILYEVAANTNVSLIGAAEPAAVSNGKSVPDGEIDDSKETADPEPRIYAETLEDGPTEELFTFVHTATTHNISGNETCIDASKLEAALDANQYVSVDQKQGASGARYVEGGVGHWCIFHEDPSVPIAAGEQFTVSVSSAIPEPSAPATAE